MTPLQALIWSAILSVIRYTIDATREDIARWKEREHDNW